MVCEYMMKKQMQCYRLFDDLMRTTLSKLTKTFNFTFTKLLPYLIYNHVRVSCLVCCVKPDFS